MAGGGGGMSSIANGVANSVNQSASNMNQGNGGYGQRSPFGGGMGGGYSGFGSSGYGSQGGNMGGLDPNAIAADPQGFSRWNQQRQQQQGNNCDCGNQANNMGGANMMAFNQGGSTSTEVRHFAGGGGGGGSPNAPGASKVDLTDPFSASLAAKANPAAYADTPYAQGASQAAAINQANNSAPAISSDYKSGNEQFFQPIYRGQYENYANPATANSVSNYGTGPQQSFHMPTTFNPFSDLGGQGQQFQVPQFQVPQFQPMAQMGLNEGGIASLVNKE